MRRWASRCTGVILAAGMNAALAAEPSPDPALLEFLAEWGAAAAWLDTVLDDTPAAPGPDSVEEGDDAETTD